MTVGLMLVGATSANAISFYFDDLSATKVNVGDTFTIKVRMDTEGETDITSVFMSTFNNDASVASFVSGESPGAILFLTSTFAGIGRVSQPYVVDTDPVGTVRAVSYAADLSSGVSSPTQLLATLTFEAAAPGIVSWDSLLAPGDGVTVNGVDVSDSLTFNSGSTSVTVIPEPATVLLMGLGLAGLAAAGRRNDSSRIDSSSWLETPKDCSQSRKPRKSGGCLGF